MLVVSEVIRNAKGEDLSSKEVDFFDIEWFESTRKLLRKVSHKGEEVGLRILKENLRLNITMCYGRMGIKYCWSMYCRLMQWWFSQRQ